ncbi:MAG TPA: hypothetical protein VK465_00195 [Fibrobacteria bacterium]|nr:hypothetical protein [Fibrobacteria bacterium]
MSGYEGIKNKRFNRHYRRVYEKTGIPPDNYPLTVKVPLDIAVLFFRRFESHPLVDKITNTEVRPNELVAHLMWAYANGFPITNNPNVFEPFFAGMYQERQRRTKKEEGALRKVKNPNEKRGRKPRRQIDLFSAGVAPLEGDPPPTMEGGQKQSQSLPEGSEQPQNSIEPTQGGASEGRSIEP